jgi:hypothetical protein
LLFDEYLQTLEQHAKQRRGPPSLPIRAPQRAARAWRVLERQIVDVEMIGWYMETAGN